MVRSRVRRWSGGSISCQEAESCRHQGEVDQNMIIIDDLLSMQWSSIQAPTWTHSSVKYNFVNVLFQGEWESNEASEDVFKDLLRVKKLSQRVSSVESETVFSFRLMLKLFLLLKVTDSPLWPPWPTTTAVWCPRAATCRSVFACIYNCICICIALYLHCIVFALHCIRITFYLHCIVFY